MNFELLDPPHEEEEDRIDCGTDQCSYLEPRVLIETICELKELFTSCKALAKLFRHL